MTASTPDPETGLPIGPRDDLPPARQPERIVLEGRYCRLEPLDRTSHGDDLSAATTGADVPARFVYLGQAAPSSRADLDARLDLAAASADPLYFAVIDRATKRVGGWQTHMRIDPVHGTIEIGNIFWGRDIARTRVTTEAVYLFMRHAFDDLGYRRYEWKCNALNAPSRRAAERFGFVYEGTFRRHMIIKGHSRDTTWYAITLDDWPRVRAGMQRWLAPDNFDAAGVQRQRLEDVMRNRS
jgi:RimJ/RimL family protein N-acetyltransferase